MRASDYGASMDHDHDRRIFSTVAHFYGVGPRGYRRSDARIRDEVCELLKWDPDVDASEIEVEVRDAVVYLKGGVDSRHAKRRAERILDDVFGVQDVQNQLFLRQRLDLESDKLVARGDEGLFTQEVHPT